jgi:hypothetical protein
VEYELNALAQFEEVVTNGLDALEKQRLEQLLAQADQTSPVTKSLQRVLHQVQPIQPTAPRFVLLAIRFSRRGYQRFWRLRYSSRLVAGLFVVEAITFPLAIWLNLASNFHSATDFLQASRHYTYNSLAIGQLASTVIASAFALAGAIRLPSSRRRAYELFRRAILINLLLTEFFLFARLQFGAIPGLILNLILLVGTHYAAEEEDRHAKKSTP